jgi:hypothetical protein
MAGFSIVRNRSPYSVGKGADIKSELDELSALIHRELNIPTETKVRETSTAGSFTKPPDSANLRYSNHPTDEDEE